MKLGFQWLHEWQALRTLSSAFMYLSEEFIKSYENHLYEQAGAINQAMKIIHNSMCDIKNLPGKRVS